MAPQWVAKRHGALSRAAERQISEEQYEAVKEKSLALGLIRKGLGQSKARLDSAAVATIRELRSSPNSSEATRSAPGAWEQPSRWG